MTTPITIPIVLPRRAPRTIGMMPSSASKKKIMPKPKLPMMVSPQVCLNSDALRRIDGAIPFFSKISTGMIKKVTYVQAKPMIPAMIFPAHPARSRIACKIIPMVAEISAQMRIRPMFWEAIRNPSATVGSPPFNRIFAHPMIAVLKKITIKNKTK